MPEFVISNLRIGKCKKPDKLEKKMTKELRRTAGIKKNKELKCRVYNDTVEFEGKKDVISRWDIEKTQRNRNYRIIVVATKTKKKNHNKIFTMKFLEDSAFLRFYDTINAVPIAPIGERTPPPTPVVVYTPDSQKRKQSVTSILEDSHVYNEVPYSQIGDFGRRPSPAGSLSESSTAIHVITELPTKKVQSSRRSSTISLTLPTKVVVEERSITAQTSPSSRSPTPERQRIQTKSEMSQVDLSLLAEVSFYNTRSQVSRNTNSVTFVSTEGMKLRNRASSEGNLLDNTLDNSEYSYTSSLDESQRYSLVPLSSRMKNRSYSYVIENKRESASDISRSPSMPSSSDSSPYNSSNSKKSWDSSSSSSYSSSSSSTSSLLSIDSEVRTVSSIPVIVKYLECPSCRSRSVSLVN